MDQVPANPPSSPEEADGVGRRAFMRVAGTGATAAGGLAVLGAFAPAALASPHADSAAPVTASGELVDAGIGMHASLSTVQMMAIASVTKSLVSCSVAQLGLDSSAIAILKPILTPILGRGWTGPFAMLMYSTKVTSYNINRAKGVIRAKGTVRSVTKMGGALIEDVHSPFLCVATDGRTSGEDSFYLNFTSPFWSSPNPLATPSKFVHGWSMFGGNLIIGEVTVRR